MNSTYSYIMSLTWYRDDWYILIGHHPWRAALLHIEVSCLEKSPTGTQREKNSEMPQRSLLGSRYPIVLRSGLSTSAAKSWIKWHENSRKLLMKAPEWAGHSWSHTESLTLSCSWKHILSRLQGTGKQLAASHSAAQNLALYSNSRQLIQTQILSSGQNTSLSGDPTPVWKSTQAAS